MSALRCWGGAMTAFWINVLWSMSAQLYWEKENGNLALYIMAPSSMMAILLGMALGGDQKGRRPWIYERSNLDPAERAGI